MCRVIDGPSPRKDGATASYVVVETDPAVEWHGDESYAERWGPEHPLCRRIEPTRLLLVLATAPTTGWQLRTTGDWSVPAAPIVNGGRTVESAETVPGLAMKVAVRASSTT
jgi:hypothetical protein